MTFCERMFVVPFDIRLLAWLFTTFLSMVDSVWQTVFVSADCSVETDRPACETITLVLHRQSFE
jgi:hypothetical protein